MGRYKGRSQVACHNCHSSKLRCSGGHPCERCQNRGRECVYPIRDRLLTVPESYLRGLERQVNLSRQTVLDESAQGAATSSTSSANATPGESAQQQPSPPASGQSSTVDDGQSSLEDCSAEGFVRRLRELSLAPEPGGSSSNLHSHNARHSTNNHAPSYTYSRLNFDVIQPDVSFKLPPRQYAFHLLGVFEEGFCDYHWFLRKRFRQRLAVTYASPSSQAPDRNWLCRVSVVLALAETWNRGRSFLGEDPTLPLLSQIARPSSEVPASSDVPLTPQPRLPPGSEFFEQGLLLLKLSLEEPVIEDVEALNLIAFYCYSLNRRNSAYFYAAQSISLAKLLSLDKIEEPSDNPIEQLAQEERIMQEHRKRIWWTSYCMNRMVSTELGIPPAHEPASKDLQLPSSTDLTPEDEEEFFDPSLLTAQTQLCQIKFKVVETASHHIRMSADRNPLDVLGPCLTTLQEWRQHLPRSMSFTFDNGIPKEMLELPAARVVASLYLRWHQCFILLLRSFFLQQLSFLVQNPGRRAGESNLGSLHNFISGGNDLVAMKLQCVSAARNNCRILIDLWKCGKIAKYGYWESLHLFSGLSILLLSKVVFPDDAVTNRLYPATAEFSSAADAELYDMARSLLEEMARLGNPASKDHEALLTDVEQVVEMVTGGMGQQQQQQQQQQPQQQQQRDTHHPHVHPYAHNPHSQVVGVVGAPVINDNSSNTQSTVGQHWLETIGTDEGIPLDHFWQDIDWETVLSSYTRATPNQQ